MIRYPVTIYELKRRIQREPATKDWLAKAKARTSAFLAAGRYDEQTSIWSDVKGVYMQLQHNKCAYCERQLEGPEYGRIEHDIEHYRPKNAVVKWASDNPKTTINYPTGEAWEEGYYLLAYHLENYATACKTCNTPLKANAFPIAGVRGPQSDNPRKLRPEKPFLLYPVGKIDVAPEELITFSGIIPKPTSKRPSSHKYRRAEVTIEFFALERREILRQQRAERIVALGMALSRLEKNPSDSLGNTTVQFLTSAASPHCNCTRCFFELYRVNRTQAEKILQLAQAYLLRKVGVRR